MRQLPLAVRLTDTALFSTFHAGPNAEAVAHLEEVAAGRAPGPVAWVWGPPSSGKSHLLQAACAAASRAAYLPAGELAQAGPGALAGWEDRALVCLDDVDRLAGEPDWERALFGLFNGLAEAGGRLVVSASTSPGGAGFGLPDLASRLAWGAVFRLEPLDDDDRVCALRLRAAHRGLELPEESARYLLRRLPRDMRALCGWLDRLDVASLAAQKRLTVPFVREVLGRQEPVSAGAPPPGAPSR